MSAPYQPPSPVDTSRRSQRVAVVFLGAVGVLGGVVAWDAWRRASAEADAAAEQLDPSATPVATDRTYRNNDFLPGVGYYHAPYHAWYPHPFNFHDPNRGYFGGGLWQAAPFIANLLTSQPSQSAVASALAAQQARARTVPGTSNFANSNRSTGGSSFFAPRSSSTPTTAKPSTPGPSTSKPSSPAPSKSSPSIQRGGFGSSGHSSGGSGSS